MTTLNTVNGKSIVTIDGDKWIFNKLEDAIRFIFLCK